MTRSGEVMSGGEFLQRLAQIVADCPNDLTVACDKAGFPTTEEFLITLRAYLSENAIATSSELTTSAILLGAAKVWEHQHWLALLGADPWDISHPNFDWSSRGPAKAA